MKKKWNANGQVVNYIHYNGWWFYQITEAPIKKTYDRGIDLVDSKYWTYFGANMTKSQALRFLKEHYFADGYEYYICYFYHYTPNWEKKKKRGSRDRFGRKK